MSDENTQVWKGGLPYAPDVKRLTEAFPVAELQEGKVIRHDEIAPIIKTKAKTERYYGVVNSWISKQREENGIYIAWVAGVGVKVLNPGEILQHGEQRIRQKIGQTGRAVKILRYVDRERLDTIGQQRFDHQAIVSQRIAAALVAARRELAVELSPVTSLPKPKLVAK